MLVQWLTLIIQVEKETLHICILQVHEQSLDWAIAASWTKTKRSGFNYTTTQFKPN